MCFNNFYFTTWTSNHKETLKLLYTHFAQHLFIAKVNFSTEQNQHCQNSVDRFFTLCFVFPALLRPHEIADFSKVLFPIEDCIFHFPISPTLCQRMHNRQYLYRGFLQLPLEPFSVLHSRAVTVRIIHALALGFEMQVKVAIFETRHI